ncbi:hypothetical protein GN956_G81 [Arapaima gigas]
MLLSSRRWPVTLEPEKKKEVFVLWSPLLRLKLCLEEQTEWLGYRCHYRISGPHTCKKIQGQKTEEGCWVGTSLVAGTLKAAVVEQRMKTSHLPSGVRRLSGSKCPLGLRPS